MGNSIAIGIDLGTTNSVMARIKGKDPIVLDNQDSEQLTPSIVYMTEDDEPVVGKLAKDYGGADPENTILSIKRFMGRNYNDPSIKRDLEHVSYKVVQAPNGEVEVMLRGKRYSPAQISSFILGAIKRDAEATTDQEVTHAVITVPAYFGNRQRETTREAGRLAGLSVMRIIPEPTAAALAYGLDKGIEEPRTVLVYDLGGGTFDVTVMLIVAGCFNDLGKTGDMHLGGDDFDHKIMDWMIEQARLEHRIDPDTWKHDPQIMFLLKSYAEQAKIKLSKQTRVQINIPSITKVNGRPIPLVCDLSRDSFNDMIRPLVDQSIDLVTQAIQLANSTREEIDAILLVGGSTRVPIVEDRLRDVFGSKVVRSNVNPMHCVAQGAAIQTLIPPEEVVEEPVSAERPYEIPSGQGQPKPEPALPDKECPQCQKINPGTAKVCVFCGASLTLGIDSVQQKIPVPIGLQVEGDVMAVMLDDSMYYPTTQPVTHTFRTSRPGQDKVHIPVYQGRSNVASENDFLGEAMGILPPGLMENTAVLVSFSINADGILYITATLPDRPEVKVEARIEKAIATEGNNNGKSVGGETPQPLDWRAEAQGALARGGLVVSEAEGFLPDSMLEPIRVTGKQLIQAIEVNDEVNGKALHKKMEEHIDQLFVFMVLGFARRLSKDPEIAMKIGLQKADALSQAIAKADRYKAAKDVENMVKAINNDVMQALQPVFDVLNQGGGDLKDLLRASSTTGFIK